MWKNIYTSHKHKAFRHCVKVCVFWDFEPFWKNIYTGHKHKAFRHCELVCVFGDFESFCEWYTYEKFLLQSDSDSI